MLHGSQCEKQSGCRTDSKGQGAVSSPGGTQRGTRENVSLLRTGRQRLGWEEIEREQVELAGSHFVG